MDFSEKWGKSVDEAVDLALADLKLTRDEVTVEVLEEPSKGFLGLGSKLAKVRVEPVKKEEPEEAAPSMQESAAQEKPAGPQETAQARGHEHERSDGRSGGNRRQKQRKNGKKKKPQRERVVYISRRPDDLEPVESCSGVDFLKKVTEDMGLSLEFTAAANEESLYIDMKGDGVGAVIGKRGQTLDSLQYLTSLVVNKDKPKYTRVVLDVENYREKREKTLDQLAERLADKVVRTGRSVRLEPMNPYERMIIHATLQSDERVKTRSEGEEPHRRVIIELNK
ncbi:MAG: RNA-binding cell elongation regulator Jag/EloR [Anaerovoracaceae bacterium]|nr:RNA-binding cell elongation regulator Jag/EloR [Anaerovoracaceae bacterium]